MKDAWISFPHAGGDVSNGSRSTKFPDRFSPRRWGCFQSLVQVSGFNFVFPTQVGMFPRPNGACWHYDGFPHAGGDVSILPLLGVGGSQFSPRRWGCFQVRIRVSDQRTVFPTQVGMFPADRTP